MAKEIPYFRFTVAEWLNGDISFESYEHKGLFIEVCAYYWFKDCDVDYQKLCKRFASVGQLLNDLFDSQIIKITDDEFVKISFLDEQWVKASKLSRTRSKVAKDMHLQRRQLLSKSTASAVQVPIYKDKDKDKEKDKEYKEKFETFWKIYPLRNGKKVGKKKSIELFMKISFDELDNVINGAKVYGVNNQFPKDPERFLRDDIWKDLEGEPNGSSWEKTCKESEKLQKYARGEA